MSFLSNALVLNGGGRGQEADVALWVAESARVLTAGRRTNGVESRQPASCLQQWALWKAPDRVLSGENDAGGHRGSQLDPSSGRLWQPGLF